MGDGRTRAAKPAVGAATPEGTGRNRWRQGMLSTVIEDVSVSDKGVLGTSGRRTRLAVAPLPDGNHPSGALELPPFLGFGIVAIENVVLCTVHSSKPQSNATEYDSS